MKKAQLLLFAFIGVAILQSCMKPADFDFNKMANPVYNGEWAVPLATSHITLRDILTNHDNSLQTDSQGLVSLVYNVNNLSSTTADQLMKIPDLSMNLLNFSLSTTSPPITLPQGIQYTTSFSTDVPLAMANATQKLDSIYIKAGTIRLPITTSLNFNKTVHLTIKAPNIINKVTRAKIVIPQIDILPGTQSLTANIDISNCILLLKTVGGISNNIHFDIDLTIDGNVNPTLPVYGVTMPIQINNLQFERLYGNLGQFNMNLSQTVDFSIFKTNLGSGFQFGPGAISLNLNVDNSFGLPIQLNATTFTAHSDINTPHDVTINLFNPTTIAVPKKYGQDTITTIASTSPNISDAFNISPNKITFVSSAITNPSGSNNLNFVSDKSTLKANMDIMLKLFASIKDFAFQDTLSFDLKNADQLENVSFRINTTNGFPLGVQLQVFFTDDTYKVLDAMFTAPQEILKPGVLSGPTGDYKTITPTAYQFPDITYNKARLLKIKNAKKIILKAILNTPSSGANLIKIYDSYYFDSRIAIKAKANLQSK